MQCTEINNIFTIVFDYMVFYRYNKRTKYNFDESCIITEVKYIRNDSIPPKSG